MSKCAYRIVVTGRVQGVAFRHYTKLKADELELIGNVTNQLDKTVLINVCGEVIKVQDLIEWCQVGPSAAKVERMDYFEINNFEQNGFSIIR